MMITYNQQIIQIISWIEWSLDGLSFIGMTTIINHDLNMNLISEITKPTGLIGKYD